MANRTYLNKSGIYRIINVINNKFYIGSAINLRKRRNTHFEQLNNNKHHSIYLQISEETKFKISRAHLGKKKERNRYRKSF